MSGSDRKWGEWGYAKTAEGRLSESGAENGRCKCHKAYSWTFHTPLPSHALFKSLKWPRTKVVIPHCIHTSGGSTIGAGGDHPSAKLKIR